MPRREGIPLCRGFDLGATSPPVAYFDVPMKVKRRTAFPDRPPRPTGYVVCHNEQAGGMVGLERSLGAENLIKKLSIAISGQIPVPYSLTLSDLRGKSMWIDYSRLDEVLSSSGALIKP